VAASGLVCLGAVAGAWGVQGAVRLKSFCAEPADIGGYGPLVTEDGRSFRVRLLKPVAGGFAAQLSGVATREEAEALKGTRLYAPRDRLPALGEDEYYHADLIGLDVLDTGGALLGRVRAVSDHGAGDILEVATPGGGEILLPFTRAVVPTVDLSAGRIIADPPEEEDD
jgi:16S rRNA processing protein RimM